MPLPEIRHCLICEDVRIEKRNLTSLMGVYGATPYVGVRILNFQVPVSFSFVFMGSPGQGRFFIQPQLRRVDQTPIAAQFFPASSELTFAPEIGHSLFAFKISAVFPAPGKYSIALIGNGVEFFSDIFEMGQATMADFG
jgi:hypothetical protein